MNIFKNYIKSNIRIGFTLAEVLITLVIIGIIAAITIPAVINTYVETSTVSKVKKVVSTIGQAKMLAENVNGPVEDWDFNCIYTLQNSAKFWSYLRPYMQVAKDCGSSNNCYNVSKVYLLNGTEHTYNYSNVNYIYKVALADGTVIWFRPAESGKCSITEGQVPNSCAYIYFDINGEKKPNTIGRDIFSVVFSKDGIYPSLTDECYKNSTGWGCTAYILKHNDMKYLH